MAPVLQAQLRWEFAVSGAAQYKETGIRLKDTKGLFNGKIPRLQGAKCFNFWFLGVLESSRLGGRFWLRLGGLMYFVAV
jgi:hypothetical protein